MSIEFNTFYSAISTILAILIIVGKWGIFEKMGEEGWKSLIPFYGEYILFKHIWSKKMYWVTLALVTIAFGLFVAGGVGIAMNNIVLITFTFTFACVLLIASFIISIMAMYKLAKSFGQGTAFTVGLFFLSGIFYMILGFGKYDYRYNQVAA